jgi:mannitol-1-phosphate/altronate dehydrogenase
MCIENGIEIKYLSIGIAAALHYADDNDEESRRLQYDIKEKGLDSVIEDVAGFEKGGKENQGILQAFKDLETW